MSDLLTREDVAVMRRDAETWAASGTEDEGVEEWKRRWKPERIVATLEALQAENARLKETEAKGLTLAPPQATVNGWTVTLVPLQAIDSDGTRYRWDSAVGWVMETEAEFAPRENGKEKTLSLLQAEVAYLRRQVALDDNWKDPEFGGCTPDLEKPDHLNAAHQDQ